MAYKNPKVFTNLQELNEQSIRNIDLITVIKYRIRQIGHFFNRKVER